ncbi:GNAT family N-acetyltransferase [Rhodoligotrophos defluvii]|uniref:GNAT family N-acetyltransferase n=1 Tax=Rhodoligotrophos defluvii TaxID=2561934 RepID=UPI0014855187|nr:GNAT family N-acetyltransferase [Rhodoligotrophos defluvii]
MAHVSKTDFIQLTEAETAPQEASDAALSTAEWAALARSAIEPSIAADPAWVLPALQQLAPSHSAELITMKSGHDLAGVAVLQRTGWRWGLPISAWVSWSHPHHFLGTPLMSSRAAVQGFIDLIQREDVTLFTKMTLDGPAMAALQEAAARTGARLTVTARHSRACYRPNGAFSEYMAKVFPRKRRKEFRRLRARLGELGKLQLRRLGPAEDVSAWLDRFEALEAAGWKGRRRTALAHDPRVSRFLRDVAHRLAADGRLLFWALHLDGRPIAMLFAMVSGAQAWLGKIAYDEAFAPFSPGVLLMLDATADLDQRRDLTLVDSCAVPGHPMIEHLWVDRISIGDVLLTPRSMPRWQASGLHLLEAGRHRLITGLRIVKSSLAWEK